MKGWIHLCIDMQRMFAEDTPWHVPWMRDVSPAVSALAGRHPERTIFTRFVPPIRSMDMQGMWQSYYQKWWMMTGEHLPREMIEIVEPLKQLTPPARTFDKVTYSPMGHGWIAPPACAGGRGDDCTDGRRNRCLHHGDGTRGA